MERPSPNVLVQFAICATVVSSAHSVFAQDEKAKEEHQAVAKELTTDQKRQLDKAREIGKRVVRLSKSGKAAEAVPLAEEVRGIYRSVYGEKDERYAKTLLRLGDTYEWNRQHEKAAIAYRELRGLFEEGHFNNCTDYARVLSRLGLAYLGCNEPEKGSGSL